MYSDEAESDRDEGEQRRRKEAKKRQLAAQNAAGSGDFTRSEALRTLPLYLLCIDKFFSAIIGAGCSQVFMQVLKENGAVGEGTQARALRLLVDVWFCA